MEIRLLFILASLCLLPGWALLALSGIWRYWAGLQRWIVAVSLSIAFYPIFFYGLRFAFPWLTIGPYKLTALFIIFTIIIVWKLHNDWKQHFVLDRLEVAALIIFGLTLFTRFWVIRDHPYPAWSDSLHHTLLTQLTAMNGQLPFDLEPYFPIPLGQYHLGLYALTAPVQWLAQVPAHTALLWTAQMLNGLCGLGVYFVLDRKVNRWAGIIGALTVGLLSHQPAFYVNWGRFTQISSQTILLVAWWMTWDVIAMWRQTPRRDVLTLGWHVLFVSLLNAAVFLFHFSVAVFYIPLLGLVVITEFWNAAKHKRIVWVGLGIVLIAVVALVWITPALWPALQIYIDNRTRDVTQLVSPEVIELSNKAYYTFSWSAFPYLAARPWLLLLSIFCLLICFVRRNKLIFVIALWVALLLLIGNLHVLGIRLLNFTNLGAVLVMLYLPIGLIVGTGLYELGNWWRAGSTRLRLWLVLAGVVGLGFIGAYDRIADRVYGNFEPYRFFVTPGDVVAMEWIKTNTPEDALFAVNTYFWLPYAPHGTDAGYWIPYFTNRKITVGTMLNHLGTWEYHSHIVEVSRSVEKIAQDPASALNALRAFGVDYIYIGKLGDFSGTGLDASRLIAAEGAALVYQQDNVYIFQIEP
ncbi:MAG: hypothetical protein ACP5J4_17495 [Anaerolineae bacterium]